MGVSLVSSRRAIFFCAFLTTPSAPRVQVKYSSLMSGLSSQHINLNRKMLSELAQSEPYSFKALVDQVIRMRGLQPGQAAAKAAA